MTAIVCSLELIYFAFVVYSLQINQTMNKRVFYFLYNILCVIYSTYSAWMLLLFSRPITVQFKQRFLYALHYNSQKKTICISEGLAQNDQLVLFQFQSKEAAGKITTNEKKSNSIDFFVECLSALIFLEIMITFSCIIERDLIVELRNTRFRDTTKHSYFLFNSYFLQQLFSFQNITTKVTWVFLKIYQYNETFKNISISFLNQMSMRKKWEETLINYSYDGCPVWYVKKEHRTRAMSHFLNWLNSASRRPFRNWL